jgi:hypothetical protein
MKTAAVGGNTDGRFLLSLREAQATKQSRVVAMILGLLRFARNDGAENAKPFQVFIPGRS